MIKLLSIVLACSLSLTAWSAPRDLKLATMAPEGTPWADAVKEVEKRINEGSQGRVKVKSYLGGQLGGELEILQGLRRGRIDGAGLTSGALGSTIPELNVIEFPFLFESSAEADYVLDRVLFEPFKKMFADKDLVLMAWSENGWRQMAHKSKAILSPKDLAGVKIRAQESQVHLQLWKRLGANPVAIALPEVLPSLQTGMVDAFDNSALFTVAADWSSAIKHFTISNHIYQPSAVVYSKKFFDSLSAEDQKVVMLDGNQFAVPMRSAVRALDDKLLKTMTSKGITIHQLNPQQIETFRAAMGNLHAELVKELGGESKKIYDLIQVGKQEFKKSQSS